VQTEPLVKARQASEWAASRPTDETGGDGETPPPGSAHTAWPKTVRRAWAWRRARRRVVSGRSVRDFSQWAARYAAWPAV